MLYLLNDSVYCCLNLKRRVIVKVRVVGLTLLVYVLMTACAVQHSSIFTSDPSSYFMHRSDNLESSMVSDKGVKQYTIKMRGTYEQMLIQLKEYNTYLTKKINKNKMLASSNNLNIKPNGKKENSFIISYKDKSYSGTINMIVSKNDDDSFNFKVIFRES